VHLVTTTYADRPDLVAAAEDLIEAGWPAFMSADPVEVRHWHVLAAFAADLQVIVVDRDTDVPVAVGNSVPYAWDGDERSLPADGWDAALTAGAATAVAGTTTAATCALSITVDPAVRGRGLSRLALRAMRAAGAARGCADLVGPLRPSGKCHHPLVPMATYLGWEDGQGRSADPWLRTHRAIGATVAGICPRSMTIPGSVADWERWTGLRFARSGPHLVPAALVPVDIDLDQGTGLYVEPNVWIRHRLGADDLAFDPSRPAAVPAAC
jgi:hypothetical protein